MTMSTPLKTPTLCALACTGEAEDVQVLKARLKQAEAARAAAEADTGQAAAAWDAEAASLRKTAAAAESQAKEADALLLEAEQRNEVLLQERQVHSPSRTVQSGFLLQFFMDKFLSCFHLHPAATG